MKKNIVVLVIFVVLSLFMTYPLVFNMKNHITVSRGDPLLNTWILAWDFHKFNTGLSKYWDGNTFYPEKLSLAYSENLLGIALVGLPVKLLTNDIVFTYNFLILLAFILSGFGAYLLIKYLTNNNTAGVIGGIIFTFAPYHYLQLTHIQLVTVQWIPLSFLYLHRYFDTLKIKYLIYFTLFFILQSLSCLYVCFFVSIFIILFVLYYLANKKFNDIKVIVRIIMAFVFISAVLTPVLLPYEKAKTLYGFQRSKQEINTLSAHIESYLTTMDLNRIYRNILYQSKYEDQLFIGFIAWILAIAGLWPKKNDNLSENNRKTKNSIFLYIWQVLIGLNLLIIAGYVCTHGEPLQLFGKKILNSCEDTKAFTNFLGLIILRLIFDKSLRYKIKEYIISIKLNEKFYLYTTLMAIILSFGLSINFFSEKIMPGPYNILWYLMPGFKGMRVPARIGIMFVLGMSVLAGYGYKLIFQKYNKQYLGIISIVLILIEFYSLPIPMPEIRNGKNIPPVYKWISSQKGDFAIASLPSFPLFSVELIIEDIMNMYYSTFHWKKMVNGYSGYFPEVHIIYYRLMDKFPSDTATEIFRNIGVKYLIVHENDYTAQRLKLLNKNLERYKNNIAYIGKFESDSVYEILNSSFSIKKPEAIDKRLFITKERWKAKSNYGNEKAVFAFDNNKNTRWGTGSPKRPGAYFQLDFGEIYRFNRIQLNLDKSYFDYPENCRLEVSKDSKHWIKVNINEDNLAKSFLPSVIYTPADVKIDMTFTAQEARYIKITQYGKDDYYDWSIYEIEIIKNNK